MTVGVQFEPVDTLFLRDGTPFTAGGAPQADVGSLFPPHPPTIVGAFRAVLARCNGWNGRGRWPERLNDVLGDGPDDLGSLTFDGPIILRGGRPLFPAPRHLLGEVGSGNRRIVDCLRPGAMVMCDLGASVRLPEFPRNRRELKATTGQWLTRTGLEAVLRGGLPPRREIVLGHELWTEEARVGVQIDGNTGTVREGGLYSTRHIRVAQRVSMGVRIEGIPRIWSKPQGRLVPLGGESRIAECRQWNPANLMLHLPVGEIEAARKVMIVALTPLDLDGAVAQGAAPLDSVSGLRVVSACLDRAGLVGGWNSLVRQPMALKPVLPAGSVLFCEGEGLRDFVGLVKASGGLLKIGRRRKWGFGLAAIGVWPRHKEMNR